MVGGIYTRVCWIDTHSLLRILPTHYLHLRTIITMRFTSIAALSFVGAVVASPAAISPREDWKLAIGWDGKTTTPAQLDPSNVVRPTPGVSLCCRH